VVNIAFRKGRTVKYFSAILAVFSVLLAGQFGLESLQSLQAFRTDFVRQGHAEVQKPQSGLCFKSDAASRVSEAHLRPKYVRRDVVTDLPPLAVLSRISFGRLFHFEERPIFIFPRRFQTQGPRPPPTIS
jgi:hypothetical protein